MMFKDLNMKNSTDTLKTIAAIISLIAVIIIATAGTTAIGESKVEQYGINNPSPEAKVWNPSVESSYPDIDSLLEGSLVFKNDRNGSRAKRCIGSIELLNADTETELYAALEKSESTNILEYMYDYSGNPADINKSSYIAVDIRKIVSSCYDRDISNKLTVEVRKFINDNRKLFNEVALNEDYYRTELTLKEQELVLAKYFEVSKTLGDIRDTFEDYKDDNISLWNAYNEHVGEVAAYAIVRLVEEGTREYTYDEETETLNVKWEHQGEVFKSSYDIKNVSSATTPLTWDRGRGDVFGYSYSDLIYGHRMEKLIDDQKKVIAGLEQSLEQKMFARNL